jgi:hypothetical protein
MVCRKARLALENRQILASNHRAGFYSSPLKVGECLYIRPRLQGDRLLALVLIHIVLVEIFPVGLILVRFR